MVHFNLLYSAWNSAQCYVAAWMGQEFGEEWIHIYIYMAESFCCAHETNIVNWLYAYIK